MLSTYSIKGYINLICTFYSVYFSLMGVWIQCCKRTEVQDSLARRENMRVDPFASKFHSGMLVVQMTRQWMFVISVEQNPSWSLFICNQITFSAFYLFNLNTVLFGGILNDSLPQSLRSETYPIQDGAKTCHLPLQVKHRHLSTFARSFNSAEQNSEFFHLETQQ